MFSYFSLEDLDKYYNSRKQETAQQFKAPEAHNGWLRVAFNEKLLLNEILQAEAL